VIDPDIEVPEADRAEQEEPVYPPDVVLASEAAPPPEDVPEADALEQQLAAEPRWVAGAPRSVGDREADEADVIEQEEAVPPDDEDLLD
jgi:hypothetical protein